MIYRYGDSTSLFKKISRSKIFFLAIIVLVVFLEISVFGEKQSQKKVANNMNALEQEIAKLENKNLELTELLGYLKSDDFVEQEAREKLNMRKSGERVMLVPKAENPESLAGAVSGAGEIKNWRLWLEYFFGETLN
ncbi:MAG: Cell division protein FtsL [Candidatus Kuenenbacteria bacterium GW2011_GWA2_42_15]|uniref:Cell division protein FtsL n=1 Tax=Candidatus Kuenenbacteria bacterium GW2011_GWA2_42_15 TaxID=1618677 RepID=A0A0G1BS61_9BACT|nr:MAG: Cell division protein FtsL [Candidatus Kuenenbacteria bacterium GW2011_GWA2_42_15]